MTRLIFAMPSKGRLKEQTEDYFADAGLPVSQIGGVRGYAACISGLSETDVQLRSAGEISRGVIAGDCHLGVTGLDLLHETSDRLEETVRLLGPLGFGFANLVVAVPNAWVDVSTMADLDDVAARFERKHGRRLRVATKYLRQTQAYFDACGVGHYRIVESAGATEGAPAAGSAEVVVDITTTGATLAGNGLKILSDGIILKSQAYLVASLSRQWPQTALEQVERLLLALDARAEARRSVILSFDPECSQRLSAATLGGVGEQVGPGAVVCPQTKAQSVAQGLAREIGSPVRVQNCEFLYREASERFAALKQAIEARA